MNPEVVTASAARREELAANLAGVRRRIARACAAAGRVDEPSLVVVTKFFPLSDLMALADLGVADIGENREQELLEKVEGMKRMRPDLLEHPRRHFIGQLQSKKAKRVAQLADVVQSVDRLKLVSLLDAAAGDAERVLDVFVQVDLGRGAAGRGGVEPAGLEALAAAAEGAAQLRLRGLMAVAPLGEAPESAFERLAQVRARFLSSFPRATDLSAGMSGDLEAAVNIGATHLRVGGAILGSRPGAR